MRRHGPRWSWRPDTASCTSSCRRPSTRAHVVPMVPRALENLFWMGRYTERAESATRHVLALRSLLNELPPEQAEGRPAVDVLAAALTHTTATYPGLAGAGGVSDADVDEELRALLLDAGRAGSPAQSLAGLTGAAGSVRDQLSLDVFTVLGGMERARAALAAEAPTDPGEHVVDAATRILSGTLALAGITSENMVRDQGWHLLDIGRGLERALQTTTLLRWCFGEVHPLAVERHLVGAVLVAGESVLTHRRRYGGTLQVDTMLDLMLREESNPRSVAFQLTRLQRDLERLPVREHVADLRARIDSLAATVAATGGAALAEVTVQNSTDGRRPALVGVAETLQVELAAVADLIAETYFWHPSAPRPLGGLLPGTTGRGAAR